MKPPVPTVIPQATAFQPDPLATPLGAGALFIGSGPFSKVAYYLESQWYEDVDAGNRRIFVGVGSLAVLGASRPTDQGVVVMAEAKWIDGNVVFLTEAKGEYQTAQAAGSLHIADASGARLVLRSGNGTTFYFDVPSRQFVDSLNAPAPPTVTEPSDPTNIPTYAPRISNPPRPTGIFDNNDSSFLAHGYAIQNDWQQNVNGTWMQAYAGSLVSDPSQGVILVVLAWPDRPQGRPILTPNKSGSVRIVAEQNNRLTLQSDNGTVYYFDVLGMTFTASLTEVVPTVTPLPTFTPVPPSTPVPTGYTYPRPS